MGESGSLAGIPASFTPDMMAASFSPVSDRVADGGRWGRLQGDGVDGL